MLKLWKQLPTGKKIENVLLYAIAVSIMPLGVVLCVNAHLGGSGYDVLNFAIAEKLGISTSLAIYSTALFALLLTALIRRRLPRFTTFIASFFLGLFTDVWRALFVNIHAPSLAVSIAMLTAGLLVISFAIACYVRCIFPTNPTDDLVVAMCEKGMKLGVAKIIFDAVCVTLALLLGGEVGIGTLVCTVLLGPAADRFLALLAKVLGPAVDVRAAKENPPQAA